MRRLLVLLCLLAGQAGAAEISGTASVTDGDTLRIGDTRVRLFGIDAPEGKQTCERNGVVWLCGQEAGKYLRELVAGQSLACEEKDRDRYGRSVAICFLPDGRDVGAEMVDAGMALAYRQYGGSMYDAAESEAKKEARGLWADGVMFSEPWDWRRPAYFGSVWLCSPPDEPVRYHPDKCGKHARRPVPVAGNRNL
jgi:endonuclease YncB( thermonuclease family)